MKIINKIKDFLTGDLIFLPVPTLLCIIGFIVNTINYKMGYEFSQWYGFSLVIFGALLLIYSVFKTLKK
jgi:uncharacterized membrane protein